MNESSKEIIRKSKRKSNRQSNDLNLMKIDQEKNLSLTITASSMLVASRRSLETKFRPIPPATISDSAGGTEFSVNAYAEQLIVVG